jgi:hypothetical protein
MGQIGRRAELSAPEFAPLDRERAVTMLLIGAIEQHGPHLAMSVDRDLTLAVQNRALPLIDPALVVLALQVRAFGESPGHQVQHAVVDGGHAAAGAARHRCIGPSRGRAASDGPERPRRKPGAAGTGLPRSARQTGLHRR